MPLMPGKCVRTRFTYHWHSSKCTHIYYNNFPFNLLFMMMALGVEAQKDCVSCENFISMPTLSSIVCARLCSTFGWFGTRSTDSVGMNVSKKFGEWRKWMKEGSKANFSDEKIKWMCFSCFACGDFWRVSCANWRSGGVDCRTFPQLVGGWTNNKCTFSLPDQRRPNQSKSNCSHRIRYLTRSTVYSLIQSSHFWQTSTSMLRKLWIGWIGSNWSCVCVHSSVFVLPSIPFSRTTQMKD